MEEGRKRSRDEIISEIASKKLEIAALEQEAEKLKNDHALSAAKQIMRRIKNIRISNPSPNFVSVSFDDSDLTFKLSRNPYLTIEGAKVFDVIEPAECHLRYNYDSSVAREVLTVNMQMVQAQSKEEYIQKMSLFLGQIYGALVQYFVTLENYDDLEKFRELWYIAIAQ